jgi:hypothetical protein
MEKRDGEWKWLMHSQEMAKICNDVIGRSYLSSSSFSTTAAIASNTTISAHATHGQKINGWTGQCTWATGPSFWLLKLGYQQDSFARGGCARCCIGLGKLYQNRTSVFALFDYRGVLRMIRFAHDSGHVEHDPTGIGTRRGRASIGARLATLPHIVYDATVDTISRVGTLGTRNVQWKFGDGTHGRHGHGWQRALLQPPKWFRFCLYGSWR